MFENILLAYDGSEGAQHAAEYAKELAKKFDSQVVVVYAFHPVPRTWGEPLAERAIQKEVMHGNGLVDALVDQLKAEGLSVEGEVLEGMAAEVITRAAHLRKSNVIVIGSRGLGQATAFLLGSVSSRVVHSAHCPVLVVRKETP